MVGVKVGVGLYRHWVGVKVLTNGCTRMLTLRYNDEIMFVSYNLSLIPLPICTYLHRLCLHL